MTANVEIAEWISDLNDQKASASHGEIWAKVKEYRASVAHELAEKIRTDAGPIPPGRWQEGGGPSPDQAGMYHAADLIDPEVTS